MRIWETQLLENAAVLARGATKYLHSGSLYTKTVLYQEIGSLRKSKNAVTFGKVLMIFPKVPRESSTYLEVPIYR